MAWNESGGDDKDPWGNRGNQGPPDLDEAIRKLQSQLSGLFGGKGSSGGGVKGPSQGMIWLGVIVVRRLGYMPLLVFTKWTNKNAASFFDLVRCCPT